MHALYWCIPGGLPDVVAVIVLQLFCYCLLASDGCSRSCLIGELFSCSISQYAPVPCTFRWSFSLVLKFWMCCSGVDVLYDLKLGQ